MKIVDQNASSNAFKFLIATKCDLETKKEVNIDDAMNYCKKNNYNWCDKIIVTSSKTGKNIEETFMEVSQQLSKRNLQICEICGSIFDKKLKTCNICGKRAKFRMV